MFSPFCVKYGQMIICPYDANMDKSGDYIESLLKIQIQIQMRDYGGSTFVNLTGVRPLFFGGKLFFWYDG